MGWQDIVKGAGVWRGRGYSAGQPNDSEDAWERIDTQDVKWSREGLFYCGVSAHTHTHACTLASHHTENHLAYRGQVLKRPDALLERLMRTSHSHGRLL